jgi:L-amino acid N-acyltransferase YncA
VTGASAGEATILVRDAHEADLPTIADIYRHHVETGLASFEEIAPSVDELARRRREILDRGLPYLVAEFGGKVCGYAYAGPYRARTAYRFTVEDSVYVVPAAARRGVGSALLDRLIALCSERGYRQMVAIIGDSANTASIRLHAKLGFEVIGTLPAVGFKFGRWVDSVIMQRSLAVAEDEAVGAQGALCD